MKRCLACFKTYDEALPQCPHCQSPEVRIPKEPIHLAPGTVLHGRYLLGTAVGSGGFGIVYSAWDMKLETAVAVKEFFPCAMVTRAEGMRELIITKKVRWEFDQRKKRFLAEARNMAKFGTHRNIISVLEFFEENQTAYIVMELLHGMALNEYLAGNGGRIDVQLALMITNEVGNALLALHGGNIIHRDVAPDNIFICGGKEIQIKLMDLGAAKLADATDDIIDVILKPGYSPCEQYDNVQKIGPWSDVYALGATLYMMLTGRKPAEATNRKQMDEVLPPDQLNPLVSENLSNAVMKAMAVEAHMRFRTVKEFLQAINGERKVVTLAKEKKRRRFHRFWGIAAACAVVTVGLIFALTTLTDKQEEGHLAPAQISVWFRVEENSTEEKAMKAIKADFEEKYPDVELQLRAIAHEEYDAVIREAAAQNRLPDLFESSGLEEQLLENAGTLEKVIQSEQFRNAMFLDRYSTCYPDEKRMPLAIEVPMAYVITGGAVSLDYTEAFFLDLEAFQPAPVCVDRSAAGLIEKLFPVTGLSTEETFLNNQENTSAVMLSTTMRLNDVRTVLTNYEKSYAFYNGDRIPCRFIYEWSIGNGSEAQTAAAERLLSWMLGNVYQSYLMILECSDGQIPVNAICFESKIQSKYLAPLGALYEKFEFEALQP